MECQDYGPQTCESAEFVTYEDYEHGIRILETNDFTIEEGKLATEICNFYDTSSIKQD